MQLVLKNETEFREYKVRELLYDLGNDRKFLFDYDQRRTYGYGNKYEMNAVGCHWEPQDIEVDEPEYTPCDHTIKFNFIISGHPFPVEIIEILRSDGWTVTGRHRMGRKSHTTQDIVWEPWDYQLQEAPKRAALLADLEQLDMDTAKLDREISDCQALLAIMPIFPLPSTREEKGSCYHGPSQTSDVD